MQKTLAILEVSRKQDYIFKSKHLKENAEASAEIAYVTGNAFFEKAVDQRLYSKKENYVYSGGGHTVLQFETREQARKFVEQITEAAMRTFDGMEIFAKLMDFDMEEVTEKSPGAIFKRLSEELERKKARRKEAFRYTAFGLEALDGENYKPEPEKAEQKASLGLKIVSEPEGWKFPKNFEDLVYRTKNTETEDDNFLAVIHIDGNVMGARVEAIYEKEKHSWESCCESLRVFSEKIQKDFEDAFQEMVRELLKEDLSSDILPVRPVILAGDDVCFVTAGSIGIECARIFLEKLSKKQINQEPYAACAGVAIVHRKYPFHLAYNLAEALCSNAKKFGASFDEKSRISAIDWHIEFGQLKNTLEEIREDYRTEDGNHLEMRPMVVVKPAECQVDDIHDYDFFRTMCRILKENKEDIARSKMKEWRTALKQGEVETRFFIHDRQIANILYAGFDARYRKKEEKEQRYMKILKGEGSIIEEPFYAYQGEKHNVFFDAIEMMDHVVFFEGEGSV